MPHIYKITNPKGKIYIGSAVNLKRRWATYKGLYCKNQPKLYASLKKYGADAHRFEIITECTLEEMYRLEAVYGHMYDVMGKNGLNLALPKNGEFYKTKSDEARQKMSISKKGVKPWIAGKKHTKETREKLSVARKQRVIKKSTCQKLKEIAKDAKEVINLETGIFYNSMQEAANVFGLDRGEFSRMLNGIKPNKTSFDFADEKERKVFTPQPKVKKTFKKHFGIKTNFSWILNTQTGIFYQGANEACETIGRKQMYLLNRLNGKLPNNTPFIRV